MKTKELTLWNVEQLTVQEMRSTEGGFIWLLVAGAVLLLTSSCVNGNLTIQVGQTNTNNTAGGGKMEADSSFNGNDLEPMMEPGYSIHP
jgi:hypothetical protein